MVWHLTIFILFAFHYKHFPEVLFAFFFSNASGINPRCAKVHRYLSFKYWMNLYIDINWSDYIFVISLVMLICFASVGLWYMGNQARWIDSVCSMTDKQSWWYVWFTSVSARAIGPVSSKQTVWWLFDFQEIEATHRHTVHATLLSELITAQF